MSNQAFPLSWPLAWPRTKTTSRSRFGSYSKKPSVSKATDDLLLELSRMGARQITLSTNIQLRKDGLPYSNLREPDDTGAAVYFKLKNGQDCVLACDRWNTVGDNIYAIAKHIEALRGQDRWGVGSLEQAFRGYMALPEVSGPAFNCWEVLGITEGMLKSEQNIVISYRNKSLECHPDRPNGSEEKMRELNRAKQEALHAIGK